MEFDNRGREPVWVRLGGDMDCRMRAGVWTPPRKGGSLGGVAAASEASRFPPGYDLQEVAEARASSMRAPWSVLGFSANLSLQKRKALSYCRCWRPAPRRVLSAVEKTAAGQGFRPEWALRQVEQ